MDHNLLGSSVYRIVQAWILELVTMPFSRESSQPRDWTCISYISCIAGSFFSTSATREALYIHPYIYIHIYIHTHIYTHIYNYYNIHGVYILKGLMLHWNWHDVCVCVLHFLYSLSFYCQKMTALVLYFMISSVQV